MDIPRASDVIYFVVYTVSIKHPDGEKVSVYECGFEPLGSFKVPFPVKLFLVLCYFQGGIDYQPTCGYVDVARHCTSLI